MTVGPAGNSAEMQMAHTLRTALEQLTYTVFFPERAGQDILEKSSGIITLKVLGPPEKSRLSGIFER